MDASFVLKHRQNPFQERECQGNDIIDGTKTSVCIMHTRQPESHLELILRSLWWDSTSTISQRSKHSKTPRTKTPVVGKPKKAPTTSRSSFFQMLEMLRWLTPLLVPDRLFAVALVIRSGWNCFMGRWNYVASSGRLTTESASDVSPSHLFHLSPSTYRLFCLWFCFSWLFFVLGWFFCLFGSCFSCFASVKNRF